MKTIDPSVTAAANQLFMEASEGDRIDDELMAEVALEADPQVIQSIVESMNKFLAQIKAPPVEVPKGSTTLTPEAQRALNMIDKIFRDYHDSDEGLAIESLDRLYGDQLVLAQIATLKGRDFKHWSMTTTGMTETPKPEPKPEVVIEPEPEPDIDAQLMRRMR
jgi:hypothetical protein